MWSLGRIACIGDSFLRVDDLLRAPVDLEQEISVNGRLKQNTNEGGIYFDEDSFTSLQLAVKIQAVPVVKRLLEHGSIDINYTGKGGQQRTALQYAVKNVNTELVNLLIGGNANINDPPSKWRGATALQIAAIHGYLGIAWRLIDLGAEVNAPGAVVSGRTALEGAAEHGRIDMIQMLLDEGAAVTGEFGKKQYRRAVEFAGRQGHQAAARLSITFDPRQV